MCVKCGISSCGSCSGKTSQFLTGQSFYDGNPVPCNGIGAIAVGDNLNTIIENMGLTSCANEAYIANQNLILYRNLGASQSLLPVSGSFDYQVGNSNFVIPEDGEYEITADIRYTMSGTGGVTNVKSIFYLGVANPQTSYGFSYQYPVSIVNLGADMTQEGSINLNASAAMSAGTVIQIVSIGLAAGTIGTMDILSSNILIKKVG